MLAFCEWCEESSFTNCPNGGRFGDCLFIPLFWEDYFVRYPFLTTIDFVFSFFHCSGWSCDDSHLAYYSSPSPLPMLQRQTQWLLQIPTFLCGYLFYHFYGYFNVLFCFRSSKGNVRIALKCLFLLLSNKQVK